MNENESRDLWAIAEQDAHEQSRKKVQELARWIYIGIVALGSLVSLDLFAGRVSSDVLKLFGVGATAALAASSMLLVYATHYSAAGAQRNSARVFWLLDLCAYVLNIWVDYSLENAWPLGDYLTPWRMYGVVGMVVIAAFGWAIYLTLSPEQKIADVQAEQAQRAVNALLMGIKNPSAEARTSFNYWIEQSAKHMAQAAAFRVFGIVSRKSIDHKDVAAPAPDETVDSEVPTHKAQSPFERIKSAVSGNGHGPTPPNA